METSTLPRTSPDQTTVTVIKFLKNLFSLFGRPATIKCDNGGSFKSQPLCTFLETEGVIIEFNIPHQPEWMGLVERMNRTIRFSLSKSCYPDYSNWEEALRQTVTGIRRRVSVETGYSPHYLMFGVDSGLEIQSLPSKTIKVFPRAIEHDRSLLARIESQKPSTSVGEAVSFDAESYVMVLEHRIRKRSINVKTLPRYKGPYQVKDKLPHNIYRVKDERGKEYYYHVSRLLQYFLRYGVSHLSAGMLDEYY
ncbi:Pro-Pol polyprotein [Smittium culicis]|uniref:Pro-Pol polyprotein n=1 Tax=Smittium culicis TaxID=133412 RepID=A0A1R1YML5_9FUNG|nr:Pro-Pol polyprotein [Smittium culicis]